MSPSTSCKIPKDKAVDIMAVGVAEGGAEDGATQLHQGIPELQVQVTRYLIRTGPKARVVP